MAAPRIHQSVVHVLLLLAALLAMSVVPCTGRPCRKGCGKGGRCKSWGRWVRCRRRRGIFPTREELSIDERPLEYTDTYLDLGEYFDIPPNEDRSDEIEAFPLGRRASDFDDSDEAEDNYGTTRLFHDQMYLFLCTLETYEEYYGDQGLPVPEMDLDNIILESQAAEGFVTVDALMEDRPFNPGGIPSEEIDPTRVITLDREVFVETPAEDLRIAVEAAAETSPSPSTVCAGDCVGTYDKCGGKGVDGINACCSEDDQCVMKNEFYSQCRPISKPVPNGWAGAVDCSDGGYGYGDASEADGDTVSLCRVLMYRPDVPLSEKFDYFDEYGPASDGTE